jgi:hypothetical protein
MDLIPVNSSDLEGVMYDPETGILLVEFKSGNTYQYNGVQQDVFNELVSASSIGKYFNQFIKGSYSYSKI